MELSEQDIHNLGMNHVGKELQNLGYEFMGVNSDRKKNPQFVTFKKGEKTTFVLVKTSVVPDSPWVRDEKFMEKMEKHARDKEANLWFAAVELSKDENDGLPLKKTDDVYIKFNGFEVLV